MNTRTKPDRGTCPQCGFRAPLFNDPDRHGRRLMRAHTVYVGRIAHPCLGHRLPCKEDENKPALDG